MLVAVEGLELLGVVSSSTRGFQDERDQVDSGAPVELFFSSQERGSTLCEEDAESELSGP